MIWQVLAVTLILASIPGAFLFTAWALGGFDKQQNR